jgi:hypothetical protein
MRGESRTCQRLDIDTYLIFTRDTFRTFWNFHFYKSFHLGLAQK